MIFGRGQRRILGMVHLQPLPGTPWYESHSLNSIIACAVKSACALEAGGAHGCLIQTVDRVYRADDTSDSARIAALAVIVHTVVNSVSPDFLVGVQVMKNATMDSIAIAKVCSAHFVRCSGLVGTPLRDGAGESADPYSVMAYRRSIQANDIPILTEVATIHHDGAHCIKALAKDAERVGAAGLIVGDSNFDVVNQYISEIRQVAPDLRILLSGHTNHQNAAKFLAPVDGAFVGACFEDGGWGGAINEQKVRAYMETVSQLPSIASDV